MFLGKKLLLAGVNYSTMHASPTILIIVKVPASNLVTKAEGSQIVCTRISEREYGVSPC